MVTPDPPAQPIAAEEKPRTKPSVPADSWSPPSAAIIAANTATSSTVDTSRPAPLGIFGGVAHHRATGSSRSSAPVSGSGACWVVNRWRLSAGTKKPCRPSRAARTGAPASPRERRAGDPLDENACQLDARVVQPPGAGLVHERQRGEGSDPVVGGQLRWRPRRRERLQVERGLSRQAFLTDPAGNVVEPQQPGCGCGATPGGASRVAPSASPLGHEHATVGAGRTIRRPCSVSCRRHRGLKGRDVAHGGCKDSKRADVLEGS
jgi:hypothetical protein